MISINYTRLFNLRLTHNYYEDGKVRGMRLQPTRYTVRKLQGGNMLFKTIPAGMVILYRAEDDESSPLVELPSDLRLTFSMEVENKEEFYNITNLDESPTKKYSSSDLLYFSNNPSAASSDSGNPEEITHKLIDGTKNPLFTYSVELENPPAAVLLKVRNADGELVSTGKEVDGSPLPKTLTLTGDEDDRYTHQVDLRDKPAGKYTFTIRNTADDTTLKENVFYIDNELASRDILGIVDIVYESGTHDHLYGDTEEYELQFSRKETIWTYYVVNKNGHVVFDDDDLFIDDRGSGDYGTTSFSREGDEPHATVRVNGMDTVVFKSDNTIPFFEIPKASIQLKKNPGSAVLVNHLPNPSHSGVVKERSGILESEIYVFI